MTIYRKYRPKTFQELRGQEAIKRTIQNEIQSGNISHAYLFCGPRGVGKTTVARLLAKSINCEKREKDDSEPCNTCNSCREINEARSLDLVEIDAASNRGINEIREVREQVRYVPGKSQYKVFIIDEVHMLTPEAFNALLKTLEEPPSHVIFILATTQVYKLPETIISRCQRFDFTKIPKNELIKRLKYIAKEEEVKVDDEVFETIAIRSEGCSRDAESILGQLFALGETDISSDIASLVLPRSDISLIKEFVQSLLDKNAPQALDLINKLLTEGIDLERFNLDLISYLRDLLRSAILSENVAQGFSLANIKQLLDIFISKIPAIKTMTELPELPLEMAIAEICFDDRGQAQGARPKGPGPLGLAPILSTLLSKWPEVLAESMIHNSSTHLVLKMAKPISIEGNKLTLGFQYKLHYDFIRNLKNKHTIEQILEKVYGIKLVIEPQLNVAQDQFRSDDDSVITDILQTFDAEEVI